MEDVPSGSEVSRCPACGGPDLRYDTPSGDWDCLACGWTRPGPGSPKIRVVPTGEPWEERRSFSLVTWKALPDVTKVRVLPDVQVPVPRVQSLCGCRKRLQLVQVLAGTRQVRPVKQKMVTVTMTPAMWALDDEVPIGGFGIRHRLTFYRGVCSECGAGYVSFLKTMARQRFQAMLGEADYNNEQFRTTDME